MTSPPIRWLSITLVLVLAACTHASEAPRPPSVAEDSPFAAVLRRFPYREPPAAEGSGSVGDIAEAPTLRTNAHRSTPLALTTSDGAGLELTRLDARVVVDSMLAFTELRLSFLNPEARVREGRFTLQLPAGASISRLSMKVNGSWQEAEVVERRQANRVYEDFLHQRQDPALLEKKAGNEFAARVFPIPPESEKEIIVAYSEELERQEYRLPLAGMPRVRELSVRAEVLGEPGRSVLLGSRTEHLLEHDFVPEADFRVRLEKPFVALTSGQLVAIPLRLAAQANFEPIESLALGFDTSASRTFELQRDLQRLAELIARLVDLHPTLELSVFAFDQEVRPVFSGRAKNFDTTLLDPVLGDRALGASDLSMALEALHQSGAARTLLFTDAVATSGALDPKSLTGSLDRLEARGARVDIIVSGGAHDLENARGLLRGGGRLLHADQTAKELAGRLSLAPARELMPSVANAEWVHPAVLAELEPGEIRTVHARLKGAARGPLRVTLTSVDRGKPAQAAAPNPEVLNVSARAGEPVLIERSVAGAEIRRMSAQLGSMNLPNAEHAALEGTMVDLSRRYRVLCDRTALLVLETDADYARYGIDRTALSNIIGVGERGLVRIDRAILPSGGVQRLEQETREQGPRRAFESPPPLRETDATSNEGYGYEFSDDPLNFVGALAPSEDNRGLEDICAIDPGACPSVDMNKVLPAEPLAGLRAVGAGQSQNCRSGPLRRWAAGVPRSKSCEPPRAARRPALARSWSPEPFVEPYSGRFAEIMHLIVSGDIDGAQREALAWRDADPANALALVALGEALEAAGKRAAAARAYGSLIDLYPSRADLRRFAAGRLERLGTVGHRLSEDSYRHALEQRPDHATSHQLLAYALLGQGRADEAFNVFDSLAQAQGFDSRELLEDLRLIAAILIAQKSNAAPRARALLDSMGLEPTHGPTTRLLLTWETDTNDVDLHIVDRSGQHAFYEHVAFADGSRLLSDVTSGYGPEEFLLAPEHTGAPYQVFVHYYARGPMGFGMGKVDVISHDGNGNVSIDTRPFVILNDNATVHLGHVGSRVR